MHIKRMWKGVSIIFKKICMGVVGVEQDQNMSEKSVFNTLVQRKCFRRSSLKTLCTKKLKTPLANERTNDDSPYWIRKKKQNDDPSTEIVTPPPMPIDNGHPLKCFYSIF